MKDILHSLMKDYLAERREVKPLTPQSWLRISSLAQVCPRAEALRVQYDRVGEDIITADQKIAMNLGTGMHFVMQNLILPAMGGVLLGRWRCLGCNRVMGGRQVWEEPFTVEEFQQAQIYRPAKCVCGVELDANSSLYEEQHILSNEYRLMGHPDGFLTLQDMLGLGVLEVKSISSRGAWQVRGCPQLDHVVQIQCYMWRTGCRWGRIVYWDKGTYGLKGIISHIVHYDEDHVAAIQNMVRDVWKGVDGSLMPERICYSPDCKRAEGCHMVKECFNA